MCYQNRIIYSFSTYLKNTAFQSQLTQNFSFPNYNIHRQFHFIIPRFEVSNLNVNDCKITNKFLFRACDADIASNQIAVRKARKSQSFNVPTRFGRRQKGPWRVGLLPLDAKQGGGYGNTHDGANERNISCSMSKEMDW